MSLCQTADCPGSRVGNSKGLCGLLPDDVQDRLVAAGSVQDFPAGRVIWDGDAAPGFVALVLSGYLRLQRYGLDGQRQILSLMTPGDIIGEYPGRSVGSTLEAATPVRLFRLENAVFDTLMEEEPDLRRAVYLLRQAKLDQLRWMTWALGALSAEERVCAFLALATQHMPYELQADGTGVLTVDLPRADLADFLGTSAESISRITNRLAAAGVIAILNARQFVVNDLDALVRLGCLQGTFGKIDFPRDLFGGGALAAVPPIVNEKLRAPATPTGRMASVVRLRTRRGGVRAEPGILAR